MKARAIHVPSGLSFPVEERFKGWVIRAWPWIMPGVFVALAVAARIPLFAHESEDYRRALRSWLGYLATRPGLDSLREEFAIYTPPYLYLLKLTTFLPEPGVVPIKVIGTLFDLFMALGVYLLVRHRFPSSPIRPVAAAIILLFSPTVMLNSAMWGQADGTYTAFLLISLYFLLRQKLGLAFALFGVAVAFKFQAMFLLPLLGIAYLRWRGSILSAAAAGLTYLAMMVPAMLAGHTLYDVIRTYKRQSDFYRFLSANAPTVFEWIPDAFYDQFVPFGYACAIAAMLGLVSLAILSRRALSTEIVLKLALAFVLVVPFVTPKMHDRYFFVADVISIVYAFYFPRAFYLPIMIGTGSLMVYLPYLFKVQIVPFSLVALWMLVPVVLVLRDCVVTLFGPPGSDDEPRGGAAVDGPAPTSAPDRLLAPT